jgi:hypothetical protein
LVPAAAVCGRVAGCFAAAGFDAVGVLGRGAADFDAAEVLGRWAVDFDAAPVLGRDAAGDGLLGVAGRLIDGLLRAAGADRAPPPPPPPRPPPPPPPRPPPRPTTSLPMRAIVKPIKNIVMPRFMGGSPHLDLNLAESFRRELL